MKIFILIVIILFCIAICASLIGNKKDVPQAKSIKNIGKRSFTPTEAKNRALEEFMAIDRKVEEMEAQKKAYDDWNLDKINTDDTFRHLPSMSIGDVYRCGKMFSVDDVDMFPYDRNRFYRLYDNYIVNANRNEKDFMIYGIDLEKVGVNLFEASGFNKVGKDFIDPEGRTINLKTAKIVSVMGNGISSNGINGSISFNKDTKKIELTVTGSEQINKAIFLWGFEK